MLEETRTWLQVILIGDEGIRNPLLYGMHNKLPMHGLLDYSTGGDVVIHGLFRSFSAAI
jgi:hypothetical protein